MATFYFFPVWQPSYSKVGNLTLFGTLCGGLGAAELSVLFRTGKKEGCMRKVLGLVGATLLFAGPALGADLGRPPPYKAPPLVPVFSWTGWYIGAHGGYGWSHMPDLLDVKGTGGFGGGQVGYNYQVNNYLVLGIEGDIAGGDISASETAFGITAKFSTNALASLRGRLGLAFGNALLYGTGGGGWAHSKLSLSVPGLEVSDSQWLSGWTAGGGVEYAFMPNWSGKIEYLHYGFSSETFRILGVPISSGKIDVDTIKAGINYHF